MTAGLSHVKNSNSALKSTKVGNYASVTVVGIVMGICTLICISQLFNSPGYKVNFEH